MLQYDVAQKIIMCLVYPAEAFLAQFSALIQQPQFAFRIEAIVEITQLQRM
jgi:hypothetical protein